MVVLWWGARLVIDSRLSAGALSAFFVFAVYVAANFGMLLGVFSTVVQVGRSAAARFGQACGFCSGLLPLWSAAQAADCAASG